ncbi:MAG: SDR family oxidoreductase [Sphingomonadales bacterium]|nr:SDR family oxidoreductase [Sphingomonadales bacterium]
MAVRLKGKNAIVTGAGSGMGRAIAEAFAREGAMVLCADVSGRQEETARAIGEQALPLQVDVSISAEVQGMIATAEERFGRLDILVNNAGIGGAPGPFHEQDDDAFDRVIAVNLKGVFLGMKYGIAAMLRGGGGAIVNMASAAGLVGTPGLSTYGASKGGVVQLTKTAALEYAQQNIRVNAICPGLIWTPMVPGQDGSRVPPPGTPPPPGMPMGRWGLDTEIAATALFLASDEAGYLTVAALPVDGAFTAG